MTSPFTAAWYCPDCDVSWRSMCAERCWVCGGVGRNGVPRELFLTGNSAVYYADDWCKGMVA